MDSVGEGGKIKKKKKKKKTTNKKNSKMLQLALELEHANTSESTKPQRKTESVQS